MGNTKFSRLNWAVLILFGLIGQIAWSVENMYFNMFVFDTVAPNLSAITLMVQLSGITATVVTLIAGTLSDKSGNRRSFISIGYIIWGVTVAIFGFLSPGLTESLFGVDTDTAVRLTLIFVIVGDCIMTLFGSSANDASFNSWVTDNTDKEYRGTVEGVLSILPLAAMLIQRAVNNNACCRINLDKFVYASKKTATQNKNIHRLCVFILPPIGVVEHFHDHPVEEKASLIALHKRICIFP